MRSFITYLPLLLTLLVPLGLLAWLGSRELSRLEDRSTSVLQEEAHRFLQNEERKVRSDIQRLARDSLDTSVGKLLSDEELSLVEASRSLGEEPFILLAFVTDENFNLIAPRAPRAKTPSAPLHRFPVGEDSESKDLLRADVLCNMGDRTGAIQCLESYIGTYRDSRDHTEGLAWAYFRLAGLLDREGNNPEGSIFNYIGASLKAELICQSRPTEDAAAIIILSDLRQAQIDLRLDDMLRVLERISTNRYEFMDYVAEDVLEYVVRRIANSIPAESRPHVERRDAALALNSVREAGRRFALDFDARARSQLRQEQARSRPLDSDGIIFHALSTERGAGLLALRPARHGETKRFEGAAWIGLLMDLPALVGSSLSGSPTSGPGNVALAVSDPAGVALLHNENLVEPRLRPKIQFAPVVSPLAGLEFVAIPLTDPTEIQSAARNQVILLLILVVVAAGGAFMLIRSVKRETELAKMKVMLLSRVSHELKTPLAVIKMYGETLGLGRTKSPEQASQFAHIISAEADRLTHMVERILDFSKMEAGTFSYDKQRIDLGELVEEIADEYQPHVEAQGLQLHNEIDHGLHANVDPRAMASSVLNLLENALKYTPKDAPNRAVDVRLHRINGSAVLEVSDRGVGIPKDELDKVFQDFYRASNAGEIRGAGLGLSLVNHFATAHGGRVEAQARPNGGTIIRLALPLANDPDPTDRNS